MNDDELDAVAEGLAVSDVTPGWYWARRKVNDQIGIVEVVEVVENHWRELRVWAMRYEQSAPLTHFADFVRIEVPQ